MQDADLREAFFAHTKGQDMFTRRMAIILANMADQSVRSLIYRLERMDLVRDGTWDWFQANGGFTKEHYREALEQFQS